MTLFATAPTPVQDFPGEVPATPPDSLSWVADAHRLDDSAVLANLLGRRAARRLFQGFESIRAAVLAGDPELISTGLTPRQIAALRASVELGVRATSAPLIGRRLAGPDDVAACFGPRLAMKLVEEFRAAVLDVRHRVTRELLIARGSLTGVEVHPRDVFRELIRVGAAAVIFVHNHPSGDPTPSAQDVALTVRLRQVGELVGIPVLDHVVVGSGGRWSRVET